MPRSQPGLDGQRFFATWAQAADVDIDDLADHISNLVTFDWLEIVQEYHQDDGIHYHAVIVFSTRYRGGMDAFDFAGHHPNIAPIKNATVDLTNYRHYIRKGLRPKEDEHTVKSHKTKACDYIIEPGTWVNHLIHFFHLTDYTAYLDTRGTVPIYIATAGRLDWGGILREATTQNEFLALVALHQPKEWVLRNDAIERFAAKRYAQIKPAEEIYPVTSWNIPNELDQWCKDVFSEVRTASPRSFFSF